MQNTISITATQPVTADTFVEAALAGSVKFHSVRADGTQRRIQLLTGDELETGEWVMEQREANVPMRNIARTMHVAVPTVRRLINRYLLTEEVTEADADELAEMAALANEGITADDVEADAIQTAQDKLSHDADPDEVAVELAAVLQASLDAQAA